MQESKEQEQNTVEDGLVVKYSKQLINWCKNQEVSFVSYIGALFALIMSSIWLSDKNSIFYNTFIVLFVSLFIFGFFWDSIRIMKIYYGKFLGGMILLIVSIILYFTYLQAESIAQNIVSETTGENFIFFKTSVAYFKGIYFVPALMILLSKNIVYISLVAILFFYASIFVIPKWKSQQKRFFHIFLYLISLTVIFFSFIHLDIEKLYENIFGQDYIPKKIIEYSYHRNSHCKNLSENKLISFTSNGYVSIANINKKDNNISFDTQKCKR